MLKLCGDSLVGIGFSRVMTVARYTGGNVRVSVSGSTPEELLPYIADAVVRQISWQLMFTVGMASGTLRPGNTALIPAGNLAGLPAIFFPCGFGTDGLPVGLQLVGPPFSEPLLVAIVAAYQRITDHHLKRPHARRAGRI